MEQHAPYHASIRTANRVAVDRGRTGRRNASVAVPLHSGRPVVNAFTVDVEDYYHVSAFADRIHPRQWDGYESRVVGNTRRVLRMLDRCGTRGTFFVLGWVAARYPGLVREIASAGHEVGCHSFWHRLIYQLTPDEFARDLVHGRDVLENITGQAITAYRAPSFSITERSLWAIDLLIEHGFRYDSSIFPIYHDRYGVPGARRFPYRVLRGTAALTEFPPSVHRWLGLNVPVSGGGFFRLYPVRLSCHWLGLINRRVRQPFMFYIHPWEIDPEQPRLPGTASCRFRHYLNLASTESKLAYLLRRFSFGALTESLVDAVVEPEKAPAGKASCAPMRVRGGAEA